MFHDQLLTVIVQKSCQKDGGIHANCQRLLLFDEERPTTHEFEQTLKNFCCLFNLEKKNMVQIYEQVVSDIENKDTHCNFLHWLQNFDYFTNICSRRVLLFWPTEGVQN